MQPSPIKFDLKKLYDQDAIWLQKDDPETGRTKYELNPVIEAVIQYTDVLGMPRLTASTFPTFIVRMRLYDAVEGPIYADPDTGARSLAYDEVALALGLGTNVQAKKSKEFLSRLLMREEDRAGQFVRSFLAREEGASTQASATA